jgi:DNA-binding FadR family transcriptional regulator
MFRLLPVAEPASALAGLPTVVRRITPAYQQVAEELRRLIVAGELAPGERLPGEPELSTLFGVGRSTVREALRVLSSQRLVRTTRGATGGTFVATPGAEQVSDLLETGIGLLAGVSEVEVSELLEARAMLEVPAARLAATRRDQAALDALHAAAAAERKARSASAAERFSEHRTFHEAIVDATGNRLLSLMCRPVFNVLGSRFQRDAAPARFWGRVDADHDRILAAIEARDPETAGDEMAAHLRRLESTYRRIDRKRRP